MSLRPHHPARRGRRSAAGWPTVWLSAWAQAARLAACLTAWLPACRPAWLPAWLAGSLAIGAPLLPAPCAAHAMPESRVWVDTQPDGLRLTLLLPLNRLEFAFGQPLIDDPQAVLPRHRQALADYVQRHVSARSGGLPWQTLPPQALRVIGDDGSADLEVVLQLRAPLGASLRQLWLHYDAVTHEVKTHRVQFFLRNDWAGGLIGQPPQPLGQLDATHAQLALALPQAQPGAGLRTLLVDGARHIAEGLDHLLFLLLLLLVAPLAAQDQRWQGQRPAAQVLRRLAGLVTAFTLGHSATLALGSLGLLQPPAAAVETAVAGTLVLSAAHAWRPLWAGREAAMALGFGLVHGFAFSASLSGGGLSIAQHAQALLAFNLGIEAAQLLLMLLLTPLLLTLAGRTQRLYGALRVGMAGLGGVAGLLWLLSRAGITNLVPAALGG